MNLKTNILLILIFIAILIFGDKAIMLNIYADYLVIDFADFMIGILTVILTIILIIKCCKLLFAKE